MRITRRFSAAALGTCLSLSIAAAPAIASATERSAAVRPAAGPVVGPQNAAAEAGAQWLAGQLNSQGFVPSTTTPGQADLSSTVQVALALASTTVNRTGADSALSYLESTVNTYVNVGGSDGPGQLALLILAADALGVNPTTIGDNLVARLLATQRASGPDTGLFGSQDPTFDGAYRQGLSLAALAGAGITSGTQIASAVSWLDNQQCPDGGWTSYQSIDNPCDGTPDNFDGPDTNSTAVALEGLAAVAAATPAISSSALGFLSAGQDADGGWSYFPNTVSAPGISDPDSTALVVQSIIALGLSPSAVLFAQPSGTPVSFLESQQLTSGPDTGALVFPVDAGGSGTANLIATYQAVPALAGVAFPFVAPPIPPIPPVTPVAPPGGSSYWLAGADGGIFAFGNAGYFGSLPALGIHVANITSMVSTADAKGYLLFGTNGGVYAFGDAVYEGSLPGDAVSVNDIVGAVPTTDGGGYWLVGADGGIFAFGDAGFIGSLPALGVRVSDVVGIVATTDGGGYWLVGKDGGIFAFGDAGFIGSLPGLGVDVTNIVGMSASPQGNGYLLSGSDGGAYAFGDVDYAGSLPGLAVHVNNVVGIAATPDGGGYWMAGSDGGVYAFGDAAFSGSVQVGANPIVSIVGSQARGGR
jgi:hypothetical protein